MLITKFSIVKKIYFRSKTLILTLKSKNQVISYIFKGEEVFEGDYWNCIYFNNQLYDINFFKYPNHKLTLYKVIDGFTDYSNFINV